VVSILLPSYTAKTGQSATVLHARSVALVIHKEHSVPKEELLQFEGLVTEILPDAAAIDRAVRNARLIFVQDFWHTTRIPASLARRTMSAVPRPPGNASTRSGLPSSSICWLHLGPPERPKSTR